MLRAGNRRASLIAYAGWKVQGIYPKVKGKTNLHPASVVGFYRLSGLQQIGRARDDIISDNKCHMES